MIKMLHLLPFLLFFFVYHLNICTYFLAGFSYNLSACFFLHINHCIQCALIKIPGNFLLFHTHKCTCIIHVWRFLCFVILHMFSIFVFMLGDRIYFCAIYLKSFKIKMGFNKSCTFNKCITFTIHLQIPPPLGFEISINIEYTQIGI